MNPRLQMQMTEARRRETLAEAAKFKKHTETWSQRAALRMLLATISRPRSCPELREDPVGSSLRQRTRD